MRLLGYVAVVPYTAYLLLVLTPVAALSYGLAALARTIWENLKSGWRDHEGDKGG